MAIYNTVIKLPLGGSDNNAMAGSKFEFLSRPSIVRIWASQNDDPGTGAKTGGQIDWTLGNVVVGDDLEPNPNFSGVAGVVKRDTDFIGEAVGDAGDRIQIRSNNTDAVAATWINYRIEVMEIA